MSEEAMEEPGVDKFTLFKDGSITQVSATIVNMVARCGPQAAFRYARGIKKPPPLPLLLGSGADKGAHIGWMERLKGHKVTPEHVTDAAIAAFEELVEGPPVDWLGEDPDRAKADSKDRLARVMPPFWRELGADIEVSSEIEPQQEIVVTLPSGLKILNVIDVADERDGNIQLCDLKTARKKWRRGKEKEGCQPQAYVYAASLVTQKPVLREFRYLVAATNEKVPTIEARSRVVPPSATKKWPDVAQSAADFLSWAHRTGDLGVPVHNSMICSWCGYREECKAAFGVEPPGGDVNE